MRRFAALLLFLLRLAGGVITAVLLLAVVALGWLTLTTGGLRFVLATVQELTDDMVQVEQADGRLFGSMDLSGVRVRTDAAHVDVERLLLSWVPGWLPGLILHIERIDAEGVRVALFSSEDDAEDDAPTQPVDIRLPGRIEIAALQARDIELLRDGEPLTRIDSVALGARAQGRRLRIVHLDVVQPDIGQVQARAALRFAPGELVIRRLRLEGPGTLRAEGTVPLGGDAPLDLALRWDDLHWPAGAPPEARIATSPEGTLRASGTFDALALEGELALAPQGRVRLAGHWRGADGFDADLRWRDLLDPQQPEAPLWRSAEGRLQAEGLPDDWRAVLSAAGEVAFRQPDEVDAGAGTQPQTPPQTLPLTVSVRAHGNTTRANIDELSLLALGGQIGGSGAVQWTPELRARARLDIAGLDPAELLADFPGRLNGNIQAEFHQRGDGPHLRADVALRDSRLRGYPLSLTAAAILAGGVLTLERGELQSGRSSLQASGRLTEPYDFRADLRSPDLEELMPGLAGSAWLNLEARGTLAELAARFNGHVDAFTGYGVSLQGADISGAIALQGTSSLSVEIEELLAGGLEVQRTRLQLDGTAEQHVLRVAAALPQGRLRLGLSGAADIEAQRWAGAVDTLDVTPAGLDGWQLREPAALRLSAQQSRLAPLCLHGTDTGTLCVEGGHDEEGIRFGWDLDSLALSYANTFLPPGMTLQGQVHGDGEIALRGGALTALEVELDIGEGRLAVPNQPALAFGPGRLRAGREGDGSLRAVLDGGLAGGRLAGTVRLAAPQPDTPQALAGELVLRLPDLDFLPLFTQEVTEASGSVEARLRLAGALDAPEGDVSVQLRDGRLVLHTPGLELTGIRADIDGDPRGRLQLDLRATSGTGSINVAGYADLLDDTVRADIRITGSDFQAVRLPEVRAWISPDLRVQVAETVQISGEVVVPRAEIEPQKFDTGGGVAPSADVILIDEEGVEPHTRMPVHARVTLTLGNRVSLTGYGLETRLAGSITVIEEPRRVTRARGALTLEDGRYEAYGQRLRIERGRIVYAGGQITEPGLDFQAVRTLRQEVRVGMIVRGTMEQPEFQLFSEPPMTQHEQLSWLVLGRPPPTFGQGGEDDAALEAAALALGLSGGDWLARSVGGRLGLDEIAVGAEDGEAGTEARLTVGKYIGSRFYISYGVSLFQPGHIFRMRYDIGRGFALQTEAGVETGADLLYTREGGRR